MRKYSLRRRTYPSLVLGITALAGCVLLFLTACENAPGSTPPSDNVGEQPAPKPQEGPPNWHEVLSDNAISQAIYAIGFSLSDGRNYVIGTGFSANYINAIWTNAHVAIGLRDALDAVYQANPSLKPVAFAVKNGTRVGGSDTHRLVYYWIHHDYDGTTNSPDLAVVVAGKDSVPLGLNFLPREYVAGLELGEPIGTMGFPGEVEKVNPYRSVPVATFKEGVISAFRPFSDSESQVTAENSKVVQHNLDLSPGTSGSPIFDRYGWVIAVNNAGTSALGIDIHTGRPTRIPSGNIGFGIRADEVWDFIDELDALSESATMSNQGARVVGARRFRDGSRLPPSPAATP